MIYHYRCKKCGDIQVHTDRANTLERYCNICAAWSVYKRVWGFQFRPAMPDHYNVSVGKGISNMAQFRSELSRVSDEKSQESARVSQMVYEETGHRTIPQEFSFAPIDLNDAAACGATNDGIHESNVAREKQGAPLLPEVK